MDLLWTAFLLGLAGSVHCAAMCGPLVLAVAGGGGRARLAYHTGRVATYCAIGLLFGAAGQSLALAGGQRWLSIVAGAAILAGLFLSSSAALQKPITRWVIRLKTAFGRVLLTRTAGSQFLLGTLNGLLPCGLVYIAAAGAATTGHTLVGALHMAAFGAGTLPVLLGVGLAGRHFAFATRFRRLVPVSVAVVAVLLVLRGLALGIPYLSPAAGASCH